MKKTFLILLLTSLFYSNITADISFNVATIKVDKAQAMIAQVFKEAESRKLKLAAAVYDPGGKLVAFARMDGVKPIVVTVALGKAYTSAIARNPTGVIQQKAQPGGPAYGGVTNIQGVVTIQGGVPIMHNGKCIGAIGVSGTAAKEDEEIALLAIKKILSSGK